jgi:hypothetical protein
LRYDAERAWRWIIAELQDDEAASEQIQRQVSDCTACSLGVAGYLAGTCKGMLQARWGQEFALKMAQHMLVEVLSSPDIINTGPTAADPDDLRPAVESPQPSGSSSPTVPTLANIHPDIRPQSK